MAVVRSLRLCAASALILLAGVGRAGADEPGPVQLAIRGHKLVPNRLVVPHGQHFTLAITNEGPGAEELESKSLRFEKLIPEGQTITIRIGPLKAASYDMFGDFHMDSCVGVLVAE